MCFSATASFAASAVLVATGAATLRWARQRDLNAGKLALASFPLLFGVQQGLEGLVWLGIDGALPAALLPLAAYGFGLFACLFWPIMMPLTGYLLERLEFRRKLFALLTTGGICVGLYMSYFVLAAPGGLVVVQDWGGGHISYVAGLGASPFVKYLYLVVSAAALLLSSDRSALIFGVVLVISFFATLFLHSIAVLGSVWCFFAAIGSLTIVLSMWREAPHLARA